MDEMAELETVSAEELKQWMDQKKDFILIDTLTNEHFNKVHLPGAVNACVFEVVFPSKVEAVTTQKHRPVVVYGSSYSSQDAVTAGAKLHRLGYTNVTALVGGIEAWRQAGYPLEGKEPTEVEAQKGPDLENRIYSVDTEQSIIEWTGRNPTNKHFGTLKISDGRLVVQDGIFTGDFEIDVRSIKNTNLAGDELQPVLIAHLLSDDFLFAEKYPEATFTIEAAHPLSESSLTAPNYEIRGALKLHGVSDEITFPATVSNLDGGAIAAEAHFDIDRTRWKIIYGSSRFFEHLGMHVVFDLISLQVRIFAR